MKKIFLVAVLVFSVILFVSLGSSKTKCGSETYSVSGSSGSYSTTNIDTSSYDGCEAEITKIEMDGDTDSGGEWMRAYWEGNSVHYDGSNVHCGRYTVWTGSDNRGEVGDSVEIGVDSDSYNDCGSQKVIFHVDFWSYNSPPDVSNPRPAESTGTSPANSENPELKVDVSDPDGDDMDVTFYNADDVSYSSDANIFQWDHSQSDGAGSLSELSARMDDGSEVNGKDGETKISKIDCGSNEECNLFKSSDTYGTCITGYIYAPESGTYSFATDSDDASDFFIDVPSTAQDHCDSVSSGNRVMDWYGSHGDCGECWSYNGDVDLDQGYHSFVYRMSDRGGGDDYKLAWQKPSDGSYSIIPSSRYYHSSGTTTVIGEAGKRTNMDDYHWHGESFSNSYSSTPLVFATTQTTNGGQDPSSAHLRNIDTNGFDTQHCEFDGGNSCDNHNREDNGWLAIAPSTLDSVEGMEAGTFQTTSGSGSYSISFDSMSQTPLLFTQSQTSDGAATRNTQARNVDSNGAYVEFCEQEYQDDCEGHTTEEVAWLAIDPSKVSESSGFEFGTVQVDDSNWNSVNFDQSFSDPVVIADVQTEGGGQEALYPEVDHVSTGGADVRYCESEADNYCDTHARETVAWLALDTGAIQMESSKSSIGTDYNVADGGTASVTWSEAVCGSTNSWSASASDGTESASTATLDFTLNCNDPPNVNSLSVTDGSSHSLNAEADVSDPDGNLDRCEFAFDSADGYATRTDNSPSGTCSSGEVPSSELGNAHLEDVDVTVTAYDTHGETDSSTTSDTFPNHAPQAENLQFTEYIGAHAFNTTAPVSDPDGGSSELDRCEWTISSPDKTVTETTQPVSGPECELVNVSNVMDGFEVGDDVQVELEVFDLHGSSATSQDSHPLKNSAPVFSEPRPPNSSVVADEVPELSVLVQDPEDSPLDVYFYDDSGSLIGKDSARAGRRGKVNWTGLLAGKTYDWHVKVSDGYTNVSNSGDDWNFTKTLSGRYRLMTDVEDRYTSIITTVDKLSYLTYSVSNPVSENRSVNLTLRGVNSSFTDGSESKEFELGSYETEQFQIQLQPQNNGTQTLEIVARDRQLGISEVEDVEVLVKEVQTSTRRAEEVPGVGMVQVLILSLMASVYWMKF